MSEKTLLAMYNFLSDGPGSKRKTLDDLPEDWQDIIFNLAKEGAGITEWGVALKVSKNLMYAFIEREQEFRDTIKSAEEICKSWWEKEGRGLDDKDFNHVLWYMNMKNRHNWADKKEVKLDHSIDDKTDPAKTKRMAAQYFEEEGKDGE